MAPTVPIDDDLFFRWANRDRHGTFIDWTDLRTCRLNNSFSDADVGSDVCSFVGSTMTFMSALGVPAEVWTDFPVTLEGPP